ncbi:hypothetical protein E0H66_23070 [Rhizobium leguminosarum bv. viciae]|nr:hypothetical protein E0H66_23070 [Rhizobium leguminosarum bv. viciae]
MPARIDDADIKKYNENYVDSSGAQDRNRTSDTRIFNPRLLSRKQSLTAENVSNSLSDINSLAENCQTPTKVVETEKVSAAALWLASNYDTVQGNPLLELMARFSLSVLDAVAASKHAHSLKYRVASSAEISAD